MSNDKWSNYLANGIAVPSDGKSPQRQDIRKLSPKQLYLYLEGLRRFQTVKSDEPLSYYQIAGIHGLPYQPWPLTFPNEGKNEDIKQKAVGGFCTHSSILFLTWHRPYLALFESTLHSHVKAAANEISSEDPDKQEYVNFAENFRMPYWDWASQDPEIVPKIATSPIYVGERPKLSEPVTKDGIQNHNPLYAFRFPEGTPGDITLKDKSGKKCEQTFRSSDKLGKDDLETQIRTLRDTPSKTKRLPTLEKERNLTERTAWILQAYQKYAAVSNNRFDNKSSDVKLKVAINYGSLEDIHNAVHVLVGGLNDGHMRKIAVSAFDPIFWLHHTNIDRLFAIWQALHQNDNHPETFVTTRSATQDNFARKETDHEETVKRTEPFGYSYPETANLAYSETEGSITKDAKRDLETKLNRIYPCAAIMIQQSLQFEETAGKEILGTAQILSQIEAKKIPATVENLESLVQELPAREELLKTFSRPLRNLAKDKKYLEWLTNIRAEKHTLDGDYTVHVFLGPPTEENTALWPLAPNHVGTFAPLGQPSDTACDKCQQDQRDSVQVTSQIPLTIALIERYLAGIIENLSEEFVIPYLTENLHWRVVQADGTILPNRSEVAGLLVFVVSNEVTLSPNEGQPPIYAPTVKVYPDITTNLQGDGRGDGTGLIRADVSPSLCS